ncbi:MAG: heavy-metal-associated domain-containing protein [Proteobacteria bacterium]|nr:heavy-metal-associated domain-containing protein [Pseudomonadota bacterium]
MKIKIFLAFILTLASNAVIADDYVVEVHGLVCSFCAQGVIKNVSKLPFIDQSRFTKGVKVEIEDQKVTISVKSGERPDIDGLFEAIRSGGYEPIEVWVVQSDGELTKVER